MLAFLFLFLFVCSHGVLRSFTFIFILEGEKLSVAREEGKEKKECLGGYLPSSEPSSPLMPVSLTLHLLGAAAATVTNAAPQLKRKRGAVFRKCIFVVLSYLDLRGMRMLFF